MIIIERDDSMFPTINKRETGVNLRKLMDQRGIKVKDIQQYLGLGSLQSVYHWLNGISMPTIDNLYALSQLFQLPMDLLVCGNRPDIVPETAVEIKTSCYRRLCAYYTKLQELHAA